jgi:hypothetical protein
LVVPSSSLGLAFRSEITALFVPSFNFTTTRALFFVAAIPAPVALATGNPVATMNICKAVLLFLTLFFGPYDTINNFSLNDLVFVYFVQPFRKSDASQCGNQTRKIVNLRPDPNPAFVSFHQVARRSAFTNHFHSPLSKLKQKSKVKLKENAKIQKHNERMNQIPKNFRRLAVLVPIIFIGEGRPIVRDVLAGKHIQQNAAIFLRKAQAEERRNKHPA